MSPAATPPSVHQRLEVTRDQLPFVGLAHVDADGLPTGFVLRYTRVSNADTAARSVFSHALDMLQDVGHTALIQDQPPPGMAAAPEAGTVKSDALPSLAAAAVYPPGVPTDVRSQPDDADMVLIPAGPFYMGGTTIEDEAPLRSVSLAALSTPTAEK